MDLPREVIAERKRDLSNFLTFRLRQAVTRLVWSRNSEPSSDPIDSESGSKMMNHRKSCFNSAVKYVADSTEKSPYSSSVNCKQFEIMKSSFPSKNRRTEMHETFGTVASELSSAALKCLEPSSAVDSISGVSVPASFGCTSSVNLSIGDNRLDRKNTPPADD